MKIKELADFVVLVGKIAIQFIMLQKKLKKFSENELDPYKRKCIEKVLDISKDQRGKLIIPKDFKYVLQNNDLPRNSSEMVEYVIKNSKYHDMDLPMRPEPEAKPVQVEAANNKQAPAKGAKGNEKKPEAKNPVPEVMINKKTLNSIEKNLNL